MYADYIVEAKQAGVKVLVIQKALIISVMLKQM